MEEVGPSNSQFDPRFPGVMSHPDVRTAAGMRMPSEQYPVAPAGVGMDSGKGVGSFAERGRQVQQEHYAAQFNTMRSPNNLAVLQTGTSKPMSGGMIVSAVRSDRAKTEAMSAGDKRKKVDWTPELHRRFVKAVEELGIEQAIPSRILELMGTKMLTRHHIASHLQKYRKHRRNLLSRGQELNNSVAAQWPPGRMNKQGGEGAKATGSSKPSKAGSSARKDSAGGQAAARQQGLDASQGAMSKSTKTGAKGRNVSNSKVVQEPKRQSNFADTGKTTAKRDRKDSSKSKTKSQAPLATVSVQPVRSIFSHCPATRHPLPDAILLCESIAPYACFACLVESIPFAAAD